MKSSKLEAIEKQLAAAERRHKRQRAAADKTSGEIHRLLERAHVERIRLLVGQHVKRRYRAARNPELNDAVGILLDVRRTRCTVDFGEHGKWTMPIDGVAPVNTEQGLLIELGGRA